MLEIDVVINGKLIQPDSQDELERIVRDTVSKRIIQILGPIRCPEHHGYPHIVAKGRSINKMDLDVKGCCGSLVQSVEEKLGARRLSGPVV